MPYCNSLLIRRKGKPAAKKIAPYAKSEDRATRDTALYALANIGDRSSQKILAEAARTENAYTRAHNTALYLLFAQRQAEAGNIDLCAQICTQAARQNKDNAGTRAAAINMLRTAVGDDLSRITKPKLRQRVKRLLAASATAPAAKQPPKGPQGNAVQVARRRIRGGSG